MQVVPGADVGACRQALVGVKPVHGRRAQLRLLRDFAHARRAGVGARLLRIGRQLRGGQPQRVFGQRHVKVVEHQVDGQIIVRCQGQLAVELPALGAAVGAKTTGFKGAVVGHQADGFTVPGAACILPVGTAKTKGAGVQLAAEFRNVRSIAREGLHHAARRIAVQQSQRPAQHLDAVGRGEADR